MRPVASALPSGIGDQLELHPPRAEEVDPALALVRRRGSRSARRAPRTPRSRRWSTAASRSSTYSATWWPPTSLLRGGAVALVGRLVLEDLEDRLPAAAEEAVAPHDRARVDVQVLGHPVAVVGARTGRASRGTRSPARRPGTPCASSRSGTVKPMWSTRAQAGQPHASLLSFGSKARSTCHVEHVSMRRLVTALDIGSNRVPGGDRHRGGAAHAEPPPLDAGRPVGRARRHRRRTGTPPTPSCCSTMFGQLVLIRAFEEYVLELAGAGPDPRPGALEHRPGGRRRRLGARADQRRTRSTARTAATTSSSPRRCTTSRPKGIDLAAAARRRRPRRCCCARSPRSAASTAAAATAAAARCTCSGRRPARWAPTPSSAAASRMAAGFAWAHRQAGTDAVVGHLLRRRRGQHRLDAGDVQPRRRLVAAALLLHREQPYAVSTSVAEATAEPRLSGARPRLRHPQLEGRRDGPARRPPRHAGGGRAHARRPRPDGRRGRHLPLLPPERRLPRQRVRLPRPRRRSRQWRRRDPLDQVAGRT